MGKKRGPKKKIRSHRLTELERGRIIGQWETGVSNKELAYRFDCTPKAIRNLIKKYEIEGFVKDKPRPGAPKKTTPRNERNIKFSSLKSRKTTAKAIALKQAPAFVKSKVSVTTVRNILKKAGLNGRVARKKPLLSPANIKKRFEWARKHRKWTLEDWQRVIFSDESPFTLFQSAGRVWVRRRAGEAFRPDCMNPTVKHGGGKIQVWGCFSYWSAGPLHRIKGLMNGAMYREILKGKMAPYVKNISGEQGVECIFQQDNDPKHTSKVVKAYLTNKQMLVLDWPSQSPDMNPIESAWKQLKSAIYDRAEKAKNLDDVFEIAKEEWSKLPVDYFQNLINSMPKRVAALYENRGHHTKY